MNDINPLIWVALLFAAILLVCFYLKWQTRPKPPEPEKTPRQLMESYLEAAEKRLVHNKIDLETKQAQVWLDEDRIKRLKKELGHDKENVAEDGAMHKVFTTKGTDTGRVNPHNEDFPLPLGV